jgi:O-antigen ligase
MYLKDDCEEMKNHGVLQGTVPGGQVDMLRPSLLLYRLEQAIRGALYVYIFSLPFSGLLFIERNVFILLIILITTWCVANRCHFFFRTPIDVPLAAFVTWVGASIPFSAIPIYSFGEFAKLLQQGLVFYWVMYFLRDSRDKPRIMALFLGTLIATGLYGLWQFDPGKVSAVKSFLGSEVALTTYLIMSLPLSVAVAVYAREDLFRTLGAIAAALSIVCQLLTFSRAGMVALFVEAIALAGLVRTRLIAIVVGIVLTIGLSTAGVLLYIGDQSKLPFIPVKSKLTTHNLVSRWKAWELGFEKVLEHPVFGVGYGKNMFQQVLQPHLDHDAEVPMAGGAHNTLLDITVGAGAPAGFAYLWLMWTIGRTGLAQFHAAHEYTGRIWSLALFLMVIGLFVRNSFDHMWVGSVAVIFWVLVGLAVKPLRP